MSVATWTGTTNAVHKPQVFAHPLRVAASVQFERSAASQTLGRLASLQARSGGGGGLAGMTMSPSVPATSVRAVPASAGSTAGLLDALSGKHLAAGVRAMATPARGARGRRVGRPRTLVRRLRSVTGLLALLLAHLAWVAQ